MDDGKKTTKNPFKLADQPAVGYKGHFIRPVGLLPLDSPLRMKSGPTFPVDAVPGKTLGIVSMILSLIGLGILGIILGIIAQITSRKAGRKNGFALAGIIIGAVNTVIIILLIFYALNFVGNGLNADTYTKAHEDTRIQSSSQQ